MPSIDLNTINFETGSWEIPPDQAAKLQSIADGLNRAIQRNPREVFLIEGHTDAVGNDVDNLSLSDRRAESAAELLTQQFGVPAENLTSQGYGAQYLQGADRRAEPHQPPRHRSPYHPPAQRRIGLAAAAATRHRPAAGVTATAGSDPAMTGRNPWHGWRRRGLLVASLLAMTAETPVRAFPREDLQPEFPLALAERAQPQRVELDEARGIAVIVATAPSSKVTRSWSYSEYLLSRPTMMTLPL